MNQGDHPPAVIAGSDATLAAAKSMWAQRQVNQVHAGGQSYLPWEMLPEKIQNYVIAETEAALTGLVSSPRLSLRDHLAACYMGRVGAGGPPTAEADFKAALQADPQLAEQARARLAQVTAQRPGGKVTDGCTISQTHEKILTSALG